MPRNPKNHSIWRNFTAQIESQPTDTLAKSILNVLLLHQSNKNWAKRWPLFDFEKVVTYYQILSPLYKMNLIFERTDSSIGEVFRLILLTIKGVLERLKLTREYALFRDSLQVNLRKKYKY
jgi:hypothetical protein